VQGRAPVISFDVEGLHPHDVCTVLDRHGVALRGGHHCAQPLMDHYDLAGTTRASLALYNDDADVDALFAGLDDAIARLR
jgi:cysteine desulfurase/selenocysteine lyase